MARESTHEETEPRPTDEDDFGDDGDGQRRGIEGAAAWMGDWSADG